MQRPRYKCTEMVLTAWVVLILSSCSKQVVVAERGRPQQPGLASSTRFLRNHGGDTLSNTRNLQTSQAQPYIIGGTQVPNGTYPFFVNSVNSNSLCGGTLIHSDIILTAAHCHGAFNYGLLLGNNEFRRINAQRAHPGFSEYPNLINDDLMVLQLDDPVDIEPVILNTDTDAPEPNIRVRAIGYGRTNPAPGTAQSEVLMETELSTIAQDECAELLSTYDNVVVGDDILCATTVEPNDESSICQGDSGGPLLLARPFQPAVQAGITSFTEDCIATPVPNGFTRVSTFVDWIVEQICDLSVDPPKDCEAVEPVDPEPGVKVEVVFRHDGNPEETTWSIRDRQGGKIVYAGPEYVALPSDEWATTVYLPYGPYFFEVFDSASDGIDGSGSVSITSVESKEFPEGRVFLDVPLAGTFTSRTQLAFRVTDPTEPTMAPTAGEGIPTISPAPTAMPTPVQTPSPTLTPRPTENPTIFPTVALTQSPTVSPTTSAPSELPSNSPTLGPSDLPSAVPTTSMAPTISSAPTSLVTPFPTSREVESAAELSLEPSSMSGTVTQRGSTVLLVIGAAWVGGLLLQ